MNPPTPETDAFENERHTMNAYRKVLDFARKLERERDEARENVRLKQAVLWYADYRVKALTGKMERLIHEHKI